jgi:hypothetical protein
MTNEIAENKAFRRFENAAVLAVEFKTLLKELKLPTGGVKSDSSFSWVKRGGHAGANTVKNFRTSAEQAGWQPLSSYNSSSPDGANIGYGTSVQKGSFVATWSSQYGVTAYYNRFSISIKALTQDAGE